MPHISEALGHQNPDKPVRRPEACPQAGVLTNYFVQVGWNTRDLLLYAVGIGAKSADLSLAFGA
jgi:hypothetical protein